MLTADRSKRVMEMNQPVAAHGTTGWTLQRISTAVTHALTRCWILILAGLGVIFVWRQTAEVARLGSALRGANLAWLLALLVGGLAVQALFALKQLLLLRLVGHRVAYAPLVEAQFQRQAVSTVVPAGGVPGLYVLIRKLEHAGVPAGDVVLAFVLFSVLGHASFAALLIPTLGWLAWHGQADIAVLVGAGMLVILAALLLTATASLLRGGRLPANLDRRLPSRARDFLEDARAHGLRLEQLTVPFVLALGVDLAGVALVYLSLQAVGAPSSLLIAAGAYAVGTLFQMLAPVFQGLGVVELTMALALERLGVGSVAAIAATLLYRVAELWLPLAVGAVLAVPRTGRVRRLPSHLPAMMTAFTGVLSVVSVLAPSIPVRHNRIEDYALLDPMDGSRTLALVAGAILLFLSYSLWRRRHMAWLVAVSLSAVAAVSHLTKHHDQSVAIVATANLALLLLYRKRFRVRGDVPTIRRGVIGFAACLLFALSYGTLGFWLMDRRDFEMDFSISSSIANTLHLFFSAGNGGLTPRTRYADWFIDSVSIVGALSLAGAAFAIGRPIVWRHRTLPHERAEAARLINAHGDSSLDFFKTWPDKLLFFSSTRMGVIAYRISTGTAIALGDPVSSDRAEFSRVLAEFVDFSDANGWRLAFHQVSPQRLADYIACGFSALKIGEEAVVDLERFSLSGHAMKGIRAAVNRIEREGFTLNYYPAPLPPDLLAELRNVSDEWLGLPGRRERGFTLGSFREEYLRETPIMALTSQSGRIEAFTNLVFDGIEGEATIDLMRHRPTAPNGAMDAIFAQLFLRLRDEGYRRFSLGMAPWFEVGVDPASPIRERAIGALTTHFERFFSVSGLRAYKQKFHPAWEPRYLIYSGDIALPQVALALIRVTEQGLIDERGHLA